ncbi:hypothetical protein K388_06018 [Streptomyces sp. KhCrAH-43]|uniref:hypothetical protein n=1 Tax=unclassified Streptomyces TaxID=2593676 RepID=UPI00036489CC|nr:hypothetical protein [Streptomyces sp. KhCrAH-43]MYS33676.1 hypothetical protein [Streptomyces sp. SID4920]MYX63731.1 hypothetical protein [Streptomyces sp. SID8373]RAJ52918.1 hypothetical protein K388_06018 [Streptomyces sp. KhCrAH-43]
MFTTHDALHQELTTTGALNGLYTALMVSAPPLAIRSHADQDTGLMFFEQSPRHRNSPISGSVTFNADSGAVIIAADGYSGHCWLKALERLTTPTATWSWHPAIEHKPGTLEGILRLGPSITAESRLGGSLHGYSASAGLALIPADREHCEPAWALAVAALGVLVTEDPAYRSPVLPAPDLSTLTGPATDYPAAVATVVEALALLDENEDFDTARDHDPIWPTVAEGAAVRALRHLRDALINAIPLQQSEQPDPAPDSTDRGERGDCLHRTRA